MKCPSCDSEKTAVIETRKRRRNVYRQRKCHNCSEKFITKESVIDGWPIEYREQSMKRLMAAKTKPETAVAPAVDYMDAWRKK